MNLTATVEDKFRELFQSEPILVKAPGRINLIGDHTDYNEGFVLPAAIDKAMTLAFSGNGTDECRVYALDLDEEYSFRLSEVRKSSGWANYILGMVAQFQEKGLTITGFDCVFGGDIPVGAGLSSSAALACGTGMGLAALHDHQLQKLDIIKMAQRAEHTFAGVQCGIMDQFASVMGQADRVIQLDCQSLDYQYFPLNLKDYQIVLCDTQVKHSLADSAYNTRRKECEMGVKVISNKFPHVQSLRDLDSKMLEEMEPRLDITTFRRCKHVVEENQRVLDGCRFLEEGNLEGFGRKMYESHHGLSKLYEVSCPELDVLVEATEGLSYVLGSRMMGGGFGGCTINLVEKSKKAEFEEEMKRVFKVHFNTDLVLYEVQIENGVRLLS